MIAFAWRGGYTHITFIDPYEQYLIGTFAFSNPLFEMLKGAGFILGIFLLTVALFTCLCEKLGECLDAFPPLTAYTVNVAFSLVGILVYAGLCWARLGPSVWLAIAAVGLLAFFPRNLFTVAPAFAAIALPILLTPAHVIWSPYYRIDLKPLSLSGNDGVPHPLGYNVEVNHDAILGAYNFNTAYVQSLPPEVRNRLLDYYNVSYRIFGPRFKHIAVLGAGAGNDVAAALRNGVHRIDAVEIDPGIIDVGRRFHPEAPYQSSKVHIINGDARTFLRQKGNGGYDMIVFGALDSHAVFSSMSSVRIDNYVYTVESFSEALPHLGPKGILAVTFYFYKPWQLERVFNALWKANGAKPVVVYSLGEQRNNLVMLAGPGANRRRTIGPPLCARAECRSSGRQRNRRTHHGRLAVPLSPRAGLSVQLRLHAAPDSGRQLHRHHSGRAVERRGIRCTHVSAGSGFHAARNQGDGQDRPAGGRHLDREHVRDRRSAVDDSARQPGRDARMVPESRSGPWRRSG